MVQVQDRPRRRSSTGPSRRPSERAVVKANNPDTFDKMNEEGTDEPFDPFGIEQDSPKRRTPHRSQSVGALSLSKVDFAETDKELTDDDMEFDAIDWDNTADSPSKKTPSKGRSRRHSMDSRPLGKKSDVDSDENGEDKKKKKRSGKTRRQSLDSAMASQTDDEEEDGFGPVRTYGFEQTATAAPSDRRKGMTRSTSGSSEMTIHSWKNIEADRNGPKRGINRRRSENPVRSSMKGSSDNSFETETTATPDSEDE